MAFDSGVAGSRRLAEEERPALCRTSGPELIWIDPPRSEIPSQRFLREGKSCWARFARFESSDAVLTYHRPLVCSARIPIPLERSVKAFSTGRRVSFAARLVAQWAASSLLENRAKYHRRHISKIYIYIYTRDLWNFFDRYHGWNVPVNEGRFVWSHRSSYPFLKCESISAGRIRGCDITMSCNR